MAYSHHFHGSLRAPTNFFRKCSFFSTLMQKVLIFVTHRRTDPRNSIIYRSSQLSPLDVIYQLFQSPGTAFSPHLLQAPQLGNLEWTQTSELSELLELSELSEFAITVNMGKIFFLTTYLTYDIVRMVNISKIIFLKTQHTYDCQNCQNGQKCHNCQIFITTYVTYL